MALFKCHTFIEIWALLCNCILLKQNRTAMPKKSSKKQNFIAPRLNDYNGDVTRRWVITYYVPDQNGELVRKRLSSFNNSFIKAVRYRDAAEAMKNLRELLQEGYTASSKEEVKLDENEGLLNLDTCKLIDALVWAKEMKFKTKRISKGSQSVYTTHLNIFSEWILENCGANYKLKQVSKNMLYKFFDHLITEKKLSDKTHNNYQINITALFSMITKRHLEYTNPMTGIEKKSYVLPKINRAFSKNQLELLRAEILKEGEAQLYLFCHMVYYCFIRPGELLRMKVKHIHPEMVELPGVQNTKIRYTNYREIPDALNELIERHGVRKRNPEEYLFLNAFTMGTKPVGVNFFKKRLNPIMKRLGLDSGAYGVYSFKHSGNVRMFEIYKDVRKNMVQNGHTDIETTLIYLRDLGINIKQDLKDFR